MKKLTSIREFSAPEESIEEASKFNLAHPSIISLICFTLILHQ
jgi:hypothetical protein